MRPNLRAVTNVVLYTVICVVVASSTFALGYVTHAMQAPATGQVGGFSVFWEAWNLVNSHFYGNTLDEVARTHGAIKGSLAALQDPYTVFVEPQQRNREQEELRGSFGGIGALVERTEDGRVLLTPMEDSPAAKAGILAGDELIAVDDVPITLEMSFDSILATVRGEIGDMVKLTIRREGADEPLVFEIKREEIVTPSVIWEMKPPDIGYIRVTIFNERTSDELRDAISELRDQGARAFVVDLRNNGGGLLVSAIDVASQFLDDGVVMYERKNNGEEKPYPVKGRGMALQDPLAVLVNSGTASASEIVAGAIQDHERGVLIGTKTFGKASVQLLFDLSDGSSLHLTNAHWLTPDRHEIENVGLTPDIEVEFSDQDQQNGLDPQLGRAIEHLHERLEQGTAASRRN